MKPPRSDSGPAVKGYRTKTTEHSQWTISKTSLKTFIGFYKKHPDLHSVCLSVHLSLFLTEAVVCFHVLLGVYAFKILASPLSLHPSNPLTVYLIFIHEPSSHPSFFNLFIHSLTISHLKNPYLTFSVHCHNLSACGCCGLC